MLQVVLVCKSSVGNSRAALRVWLYHTPVKNPFPSLLLYSIIYPHVQKKGKRCLSFCILTFLTNTSKNTTHSLWGSRFPLLKVLFLSVMVSCFHSYFTSSCRYQYSLPVDLFIARVRSQEYVKKRCDKVFLLLVGSELRALTVDADLICPAACCRWYPS